jgi:hypothetical protein
MKDSELSSKEELRQKLIEEIRKQTERLIRLNSKSTKHMLLLERRENLVKALESYFATSRSFIQFSYTFRQSPLPKCFRCSKSIEHERMIFLIQYKIGGSLRSTCVSCDKKDEPKNNPFI